MTGMAQWWPARTATPSMSRIVPMSWAWIPSHHERTGTPAFSLAVPTRRRPGMADSSFRPVGEQVRLVRRDLIASDPLDVLDGRGQPDDPRNVGRAGFELVGQRVVDRFFSKGHGADHVAAALVRGHGFQQLGLPVRAHQLPVGPKKLVPGEGVEIAVNDPARRRAMCGIDWRRPPAPGCRGDG